MQPLGRPSGIPLRRKLLFGMLALLVLYSGYAWYAGLAFTAGIETQDMDWNGDGSVSTQETLQSWYAVTVRSTKEGARECNAFYWRSEEHTSELQSLMRISYAVFCLKKNNNTHEHIRNTNTLTHKHH